MTKLFSILAILPVAAASLATSQIPAQRAWLILQQGIMSKKAGARANAAHALRLVVHNARAQEMAERALTEPKGEGHHARARSDGSRVLGAQAQGTVE